MQTDWTPQGGIWPQGWRNEDDYRELGGRVETALAQDNSWMGSAALRILKMREAPLVFTSAWQDAR